MKRRTFLQASLGAVAVAAALTPAGAVEEKKMNIVVAADPFALDLKDAIKQHLEAKGYAVTDVGATKSNELPLD